MTRIIAGRLRGRRLRVPEEGTRPTSDRVRESVFNMLEHRYDFDRAHILDLYAGSGALGLEALSRGAGSATFVDSAKAAVAAIRANAEVCGVGAEVTIVGRPVAAFLDSAASSGAAFDVVFADPPYDIEGPSVAGDLAAIAGIVSGDGFVVLERAARGAPVTWPAELAVVVDKRYGDTRVEVARRR